MVIHIPKVELFTFQASTAFDERVQLANKMNEIIDGMNSIGDIPDLENQIRTLSSQIQTINSTITDIQDTIAQQGTTIGEMQSDIDALDEQMASAMTIITELRSKIAAVESTLTEHGNEIDGLLGEVIDSVAMSSTAHGTVQVQMNHEDGSNDISAPIDLGLVEQGGITLISGTTDRSFKLHVDLTDGTAWETNDMMIPPGGGTAVSVTGITLHTGTSESYLQASIVLSDSTTIDSNDLAIVTTAQFTQLSSRITTVEGSTAEHTQRIDSLNSRVTTLEQAGGYVLVPATAAVLGGVKIGTNITVQSDGTISIPDATTSTPGVMTAAQVGQLDTAAVGSTLMFTGDANKVTFHADSVAGSAFTEDIPAAADGGAGTIDQAKYQQIATNQNDITTIQGKVTALESKVDELTPSVSVNESANPPTITVGINGKSATADLPSGGGSGISYIVFEDLPSFFNDLLNNAKTGDIYEIIDYGYSYSKIEDCSFRITVVTSYSSGESGMAFASGMIIRNSETESIFKVSFTSELSMPLMYLTTPNDSIQLKQNMPSTETDTILRKLVFKH